MFEGFANVWTPVETARKLGRQPRSIWVAGERVVLFRGTGGKAAALSDRCPHRGVALSLGKVTPAGCLECPFHGWNFDPSGACTRVPLSPHTKRDVLAATAFPTREIGGLIWIFTAPVTHPPEEPYVSAELTDPQFFRYFLIKPWAAHWTRAMENMLDSPHLPYVHRHTIGRAMRQRMKPDSEMVMETTDTASGIRIGWTMDGQDSPTWLEFHRPNAMVLNIPLPGRRLALHVWCVPARMGETRMIIAGARDFGRHNPLARLFDEVNRYIVHEDQAIVESSLPKEVPPPAEEHSVATDRPTLRFRRYYFETLRRSAATQPLRPELTLLSS